MQRPVLERLAAEAGARCAGARVRSVLPRPASGLALILEPAKTPALDLAAGPAGGHLAATTLRLPAAAEAAIPREITAGLAGQRLEGVDLLAGERVARVRLEGGDALIVEILGGAGNIYLVDGAGTVRARLREAGRPGGALPPGTPWRPPPPPGTRPPSAAEEKVGPPGEEAAATWEAPGRLPRRPGLAVPAPEAEIDPLLPWPGGPPAVRPDGPLEGDPLFLETPLLGDAVVRLTLWLERRRRAERRLGDLRRRLRREGSRLARLEKALQSEAAAAASHPDLRRRAEALLAGLSHARRQGDRVEVPDPYDPDGGWIQVPLAPGTTPQDEADRLFRQAGRLSAAEAGVRQKQEQVRERLAAVRTLAGRAEGVAALPELERLEEDLPGWLREVPGRSRSAPARPAPVRLRRLEKDPRFRKVRRFTLEGEWHVLVGGAADANDFLTFRLAAPHDFWLHAADYPGAHVVVRNPGRRADLPAAVLRRAAALAAHFSKAPGGGPVAVRWTQARHVRKGRGLPPGTVLLPRASTLRVRPEPPPRRGPEPA